MAFITAKGYMICIIISKLALIDNLTMLLLCNSIILFSYI